MGLLARARRRAVPWRPGAAASRRASIAVGVVLVLASAIAIVGSRAISSETASARSAAKASDLYQDAKFWGACEDAALNAYLLTEDPLAKEKFTAAAGSLTASLKAIESVQDAPAIRVLLDEQSTYTTNATLLFNLVDAGRTQNVTDIQRFQAEPMLAHMTDEIAAWRPSIMRAR